MKLKKLTQLGFTHIIIPVLVVVGVGIVGTAALVITHAQSLSDPYSCPSQPTMAEWSGYHTCVQRVQWFLNYNATHTTTYRYPGVTPLSIDGSFGPATRNDVINFQSDEHISADGVVGPLTWSHLNQCATSRLCD